MLFQCSNRDGFCLDDFIILFQIIALTPTLPCIQLAIVLMNKGFKRFEKTRSRMVYHAIEGGPKRPDNLPLGRLSAEGGPEGPGIGDASPTSADCRL